MGPYGSTDVPRDGSDQTLSEGSAGMDETAGDSSGRGDRFVPNII